MNRHERRAYEKKYKYNSFQKMVVQWPVWPSTEDLLPGRVYHAMVYHEDGCPALGVGPMSACRCNPNKVVHLQPDNLDEI